MMSFRGGLVVVVGGLTSANFSRVTIVVTHLFYVYTRLHRRPANKDVIYTVLSAVCRRPSGGQCPG